MTSPAGSLEPHEDWRTPPVQCAVGIQRRRAVKSSGPTRRTAENARRSEVAPTHGDETGTGSTKGLDAIEPPMELFVRRHTRLLVPLKVFPHGGQFPPNSRVQILDHGADGARPTQILGNFQGIGGQSAEFRLQFDTGLYGRCRRCRLLARFRWVYLCGTEDF